MVHHCFFMIDFEPHVRTNIECLKAKDRNEKMYFILKRGGYRPVILDTVPSGDQVKEIYEALDKTQEG